MSLKLSPEELAKLINDALSQIRFGETSIQIHNSKVVQVEKLEKFRFDNLRII